MSVAYTSENYFKEEAKKKSHLFLKVFMTKD